LELLEEPSYLNESEIREIVVKLLENKEQIRDFMEYPKEKKLSKLNAYKATVIGKIKAVKNKDV
jgi:hypothetical protein